MADLDFSWTCGETRQDEKSGYWAAAWTNFLAGSPRLESCAPANAALQEDIRRERQLEQQRLAFFSAVSHELKTQSHHPLKGSSSGIAGRGGVSLGTRDSNATAVPPGHPPDGRVWFRRILTVSPGWNPPGLPSKRSPWTWAAWLGTSWLWTAIGWSSRACAWKATFPEGGSSRRIRLLGKALGNPHFQRRELFP